MRTTFCVFLASFPGMFSLAGHCQGESNFAGLSSAPLWLSMDLLRLFFFLLLYVCVASIRWHSFGDTFSFSLSLSYAPLVLYLSFYVCLFYPFSHLASLDSGHILDGERKQKIPIGGNQPLNDNLVDIQSASQNLINGQQQ